MTRVDPVLPSATVPELAYRNRMEGLKGSFSDGIIIGMGDLTLDGEPFPWVTVGDWVLRFSDDGLATLQLQIVVTIPEPRETGRAS